MPAALRALCRCCGRVAGPVKALRLRLSGSYEKVATAWMRQCSWDEESKALSDRCTPRPRCGSASLDQRKRWSAGQSPMRRFCSADLFPNGKVLTSRGAFPLLPDARSTASRSRISSKHRHLPAHMHLQDASSPPPTAPPPLPIGHPDRRQRPHLGQAWLPAPVPAGLLRRCLSAALIRRRLGKPVAREGPQLGQPRMASVCAGRKLGAVPATVGQATLPRLDIYWDGPTLDLQSQQPEQGADGDDGKAVHAVEDAPAPLAGRSNSCWWCRWVVWTVDAVTSW
jgi:hypothetical protein